MRPDGIGNGSVIVDVGVWGFLEVLYRSGAAVERRGNCRSTLKIPGRRQAQLAEGPVKVLEILTY